jgi:hypothetical protein
MKRGVLKNVLAIVLMQGPGKSEWEIDDALNEVDPDNEWGVGAADLIDSGYLRGIDVVGKDEHECVITAKGKRYLK